MAGSVFAMAWTAPRLKWTRRVTPRDKQQHMGRGCSPQRSKSGWFAFGWWVLVRLLALTRSSIVI